MSKNIKIFFSLILIFASRLWAESEGEKLFMQNKPDEAIPVLESEISSGTASPASYNYLGLSYYQIGDYEKSVEIFQKGLKVSGTNKKILAFNAGNSLFAMGEYKKAADSFSLAYRVDKNFFQALLNRANSYLMAEDFEKALNDYRSFLENSPLEIQSDELEKMVFLLEDEVQRLEEGRLFAEAEAERIAEEERKLAAEMARIEAEKAEAERLRLEEEARLAAEKKAKDAERRRKLLEDVTASLHNTDSTSMSSGAEDIIGYEQESELD